jgi:multidrug efflux pump subunit AcrA (membrane-fusion protein)
VRKTRIAFVGLLASVSFMLGCSREESPQSPPTPVGVTTVQMYQSGNDIRYSANIIPYAQVDLAFKSGGYVETIRQVKGADGRMRDVQQGDRVSKGMVLAQVRQEDYVIKVDQAKTQLVQAKSSLESAKSQLAKAEAALNHSQLDFTRAKNLFDTQSLTKSDFDTATTHLDSDQASVSTAKSQVDAFQAQVGTTEQALRSAELSLADATLKSPMDGVVLARNVEIGTLASPGATGFVLADVSSVKAVFGVPDTMMEHVKLGTRQEIAAEAVPGRLGGLITAISPSADPKSRTFSVEVTIPNPRGQLNPGMIATLMLTAAHPAAPVPVIPLSAVIRSTQNPDGYAVFVIEDQSGKSLARIRDVELGEAYGNKIGVKTGLSLGERVITTGATLVKDGYQVQIIR